MLLVYARSKYKSASLTQNAESLLLKNIHRVFGPFLCGRKNSFRRRLLNESSLMYKDVVL